MLNAECKKLTDHLKTLTQIEGAPGFREFSLSYKAHIKTISEELLERRLSSELLNATLLLTHEFFCRTARSDYFTGIVVAGYGKEQFFPEIVEYYVDGKDESFVRQWLNMRMNTNEKDRRNTFICPFGQTDIFHLFMEGISPSNITFLSKLLGEILSEKSEELTANYVKSEDQAVENARQQKDNAKIVESFIDEFAHYRRSEIVDPILAAIIHGFEAGPV